MLTPSDIRELSDKDLTKELVKARDLLYRQKMGLMTGHLKDGHTAGQLKKYVAQLLTIQNARKTAGVEVAETKGEVSKKIDAAHAALAKSQEGKKKEVKAKAAK